MRNIYFLLKSIISHHQFATKKQQRFITNYANIASPAQKAAVLHGTRSQNGSEAKPTHPT